MQIDLFLVAWFRDVRVEGSLLFKTGRILNTDRDTKLIKLSENW